MANHKVDCSQYANTYEALHLRKWEVCLEPSFLCSPFFHFHFLWPHTLIIHQDPLLTNQPRSSQYLPPCGEGDPSASGHCQWCMANCILFMDQLCSDYPLMFIYPPLTTWQRETSQPSVSLNNGSFSRHPWFVEVGPAMACKNVYQK